MRNLFNALWSDESGQDLVEYVLIIVLIAIAAVTAMSTLGNEVNDAFQNAADQVSSGTS
jgi:pilus assembly protein Flp/PilA